VDGEYKLVLSQSDGLWDASLVRRAREQVELAPAAPQVAAALRERLAGLRALYVSGRAEQRQEFSPEDEERLRALGYLE
jgi:hypothetical protein